jgi:DNA-binding IclR family transcriptional regulator
MEAVPRLGEAVQRLKGVFLEIPGTRLSVSDASRLSGLDRPTCNMVLMALENARFLKRGHDGLYQRGATDSSAY